jgi:hypothetical protein
MNFRVRAKTLKYITSPKKCLLFIIYIYIYKYLYMHIAFLYKNVKFNIFLYFLYFYIIMFNEEF